MMFNKKSLFLLPILGVCAVANASWDGKAPVTAAEKLACNQIQRIANYVNFKCLIKLELSEPSGSMETSHYFTVVASGKAPEKEQQSYSRVVIAENSRDRSLSVMGIVDDVDLKAQIESEIAAEHYAQMSAQRLKNFESGVVSKYADAERQRYEDAKKSGLLAKGEELELDFNDIALRKNAKSIETIVEVYKNSGHSSEVSKIILELTSVGLDALAKSPNPFQLVMTYLGRHAQ